MELHEQVAILSSFNFSPINLRFFRNFSRFLISNLVNLPLTFLMKYILSHRKVQPSRREIFKKPIFKTNHYKFLTVLLKYYNIYLKSLDSG